MKITCEATWDYRASLLGRVGAGRPLLGRPYPPLTNQCLHVSAHTALPFAWILRYSVSGQHQHTPLFLSLFSQVPLACFLPNRAGFASVTWVYPSVGTAVAVCTSHYSRTL